MQLNERSLDMGVISVKFFYYLNELLSDMTDNKPGTDISAS